MYRLKAEKERKTGQKDRQDRQRERNKRARQIKRIRSPGLFVLPGCVDTRTALCESIRPRGGSGLKKD